MAGADAIGSKRVRWRVRCNTDSEGGLRHVLPNMLERTEQMRQPANQPSSSCERSVDLYHRSQRRFLDSLGVAAIHASDL